MARLDSASLLPYPPGEHSWSADPDESCRAEKLQIYLLPSIPSLSNTDFVTETQNINACWDLIINPLMQLHN